MDDKSGKDDDVVHGVNCDCDDMDSDEAYDEFVGDMSRLVETITDSLADAMFVARNATRSEQLVDVLKGLCEACAIAGGMADECGPIADAMVRQLEPESDVPPLVLTDSKQGSDPDPTLN